jgi:hypothetical protein
MQLKVQQHIANISKNMYLPPSPSSFLHRYVLLQNMKDSTFASFRQFYKLLKFSLIILTTTTTLFIFANITNPVSFLRTSQTHIAIFLYIITHTVISEKTTLTLSEHHKLTLSEHHTLTLSEHHTLTLSFSSTQKNTLPLSRSQFSKQRRMSFSETELVFVSLHLPLVGARLSFSLQLFCCRVCVSVAVLVRRGFVSIHLDKLIWFKCQSRGLCTGQSWIWHRFGVLRLVRLYRHGRYIASSDVPYLSIVVNVSHSLALWATMIVWSLLSALTGIADVGTPGADRLDTVLGHCRAGPTFPVRIITETLDHIRQTLCLGATLCADIPFGGSCRHKRPESVLECIHWLSTVWNSPILLVTFSFCFLSQ